MIWRIRRSRFLMLASEYHWILSMTRKGYFSRRVYLMESRRLRLRGGILLGWLMLSINLITWLGIVSRGIWNTLGRLAPSRKNGLMGLRSSTACYAPECAMKTESKEVTNSKLF